MTKEVLSLRLCYRDDGTGAALHRLSAVLAHQRAPVTALSTRRPNGAPDRSEMTIEFGPVDARAADQLVGRLRRQPIVRQVTVTTTSAPEAAASRDTGQNPCDEP